MSNEYDSKPNWIDNHPKEFIFNFYENKFCVGSVWYRPLEVGFEIDYIEVESLHRKNGLGTLLLQNFIADCKNKIDKFKNPNFFEIWLEVSVLNIPAIALYEKLGFKPVHVRPKYYSDGSDATVMSLRVDV